MYSALIYPDITERRRLFVVCFVEKMKLKKPPKSYSLIGGCIYLNF
jgi:hypothetical protein